MGGGLAAGVDYSGLVPLKTACSFTLGSLSAACSFNFEIVFTPLLKLCLNAQILPLHFSLPLFFILFVWALFPHFPHLPNPITIAAEPI